MDSSPLSSHLSTKVKYPVGLSRSAALIFNRDSSPVPNEQASFKNNTAHRPVPTLADESTTYAHPMLPVFAPYYATVSDSSLSPTTPNTYYPRVRYIFDDDHPDLLSSILAMRHRYLDEGHASDTQQDRAIILELNSTGSGYGITSATSLSADWAVTHAQLKPPSVTLSRSESEGSNDQGLMLQVDGITIPAGMLSTSRPRGATNSNPETAQFSPGRWVQSSNTGEKRRHSSAYKTYLDDFDQRMVLLKRIGQEADDTYERLTGSNRKQQEEVVQKAAESGLAQNIGQ